MTMNEQRARQELGVNENDSFVIVRKRYHEAVQRYHPDKNPNNPEALEKCKRAIEAYTTLCDIKKYTKTQEELEIERYMGGLFSEFWPIPQEFQTSQVSDSERTKKEISLRTLTHEQPYEDHVRERGFYEFVSP